MEKNELNQPNKEEEKFDINEINPDGIMLFLNMIGGHSFFVVYKKKYLIKVAKQREVKYYEYLFNNHINSKHLLHCYGIIEKNTKQYELIVNYKKQCKKFFREMIKFFNLSLDEVNIEKDIMFEQKFRVFIDEKNDENKDIQLNKSFEELKEQLIYIKNNNINKLIWIIFWFIKWENRFIGETDKFIVIENLDYNKIEPAIIDIKVGNEKKISKKNSQVKKYIGAFETLGCRIMGIYKKNLSFKSRYVTKTFYEDRFREELDVYFGKKKKIIESVIKQLEDMKLFIKNELFFKIFFASLLIYYDNKDETKEPSVRLIDFELTNCSTNHNYEFYSKESEKEAKIKYNTSFINCLSNLIGVLENLDSNIK